MELLGRVIDCLVRELETLPHSPLLRIAGIVIFLLLMALLLWRRRYRG